jgi:hypothetical protein
MVTDFVAEQLPPSRLDSCAYMSAWTAPNEMLLFWVQGAALMAGVLIMTTSGSSAQNAQGLIWKFRRS